MKRNPFKSQRAALDLTLREIADRCHCTSAQVWNWEHDRSAPARFDVEVLAKAYEVSVAQMVEWIADLSERSTRRRLTMRATG